MRLQTRKIESSDIGKIKNLGHTATGEHQSERFLGAWPSLSQTPRSDAPLQRAMQDRAWHEMFQASLTVQQSPHRTGAHPQPNGSSPDQAVEARNAPFS